jgi:hypothetical protein
MAVCAPLSGNPIPANVFMAVAGTLLWITVADFVAVKVRVVRNKRLMDEAQNEQSTLLWGGNEGAGQCLIFCQATL